MKLSIKNNILKMRIQVVCAVADGIASLDEDEREAIADSFRNSTKNMKCALVGYRFGERWIELSVSHSPGFDVTKAMTSFKAVSSRKIHASRGGPPGIWAPGYIAATIGEPVDPEAVVNSLLDERPKA